MQVGLLQRHIGTHLAGVLRAVGFARALTRQVQKAVGKDKGHVIGYRHGRGGQLQAELF